MIKPLILIMLSSHMLGDFYFQSEKLAENKEKSYSCLFRHSVFYACAIIVPLLLIREETILIYAIGLALSHLLIDYIKSKLSDKISETALFLSDQAIHILAILITVTLFAQNENSITMIIPLQNLLHALNINNAIILQVLQWLFMVLLIGKPANVAIKTCTKAFNPKDTEESKEGYPNAGAWIGTLERILIVLLMSMNQFSAIGLVLTAKSIARYKKISEEPAFSEYYLLGTLLSVLIAIGAYLIGR